MHEAIYTVSQGRGYGISDVPVVDLALFSSGNSWHVWSDKRAICGAKGLSATLLPEVDAKVVRVAGHAVCGRCLSQLGSVPMPRLRGEAA